MLYALIQPEQRTEGLGLKQGGVRTQVSPERCPSLRVVPVKRSSPRLRPARSSLEQTHIPFNQSCLNKQEQLREWSLQLLRPSSGTVRHSFISQIFFCSQCFQLFKLRLQTELSLNGSERCCVCETDERKAGFKRINPKNTCVRAVTERYED